jgi:hypothetical protein
MRVLLIVLLVCVSPFIMVAQEQNTNISEQVLLFEETMVSPKGIK